MPTIPKPVKGSLTFDVCRTKTGVPFRRACTPLSLESALKENPRYRPHLRSTPRFNCTSHHYPYRSSYSTSTKGAPMTPSTKGREKELLKHDINPMCSAWASRRQSSHVPGHLIQRGSVLGEELTGNPNCYEMCDSSHSTSSEVLDKEQSADERRLKIVASIVNVPEERYPAGDSIVLNAILDSPSRENDDDALRAAYAQRRSLVLDSTAPNLAPHLVITQPEETSQDCYTPWLNATGPQWSTHLMVATPPNAFDHTLMYMPTFHHLPQEHECSGQLARAVFRPSRFRSFVVSLMRESAYMHDIIDALQRRHRKAVAFSASETARSFLNCHSYICPSEKSFRWMDPAVPFLQRKNQYRGTIVIESPSPFSVPHIIINEPPPQDPWIPWHNATNNPQDYGFGRYLVVPHRLVVYSNALDGEDDCQGSPVQQVSESEEPDAHGYFEDMDYSGSSSSESEPGTPSLGPLTDEVLFGGNDQDSLSGEFLRTGEDTNVFDLPDESPWRAIMNRYPTGLDGGKAADLVGVSQTFGDEDELPPFDEWYQSVASRTAEI